MARPNPNERTVALIVAAGRGRRMGEALPKQFLPLAGQPILKRTIAAFLTADWIDRVTVVINPDDRALYDAAIRGTADDRLTAPVPGGATRAASVRLGLQALAAPAPDRVLIHDAARPFVSADLIAQVACALDEADGAFAAVPVVDALWSSQDGHALAPIPRNGMWRAQTPQGFRFGPILAAHQSADASAADDVAVARAAGLRVRIVEGSEQNFKITTPADLARAEKSLADIR